MSGLKTGRFNEVCKPHLSDAVCWTGEHRCKWRPRSFRLLQNASDILTSVAVTYRLPCSGCVASTPRCRGPQCPETFMPEARGARCARGTLAEVNEKGEERRCGGSTVASKTLESRSKKGRQKKTLNEWRLCTATFAWFLCHQVRAGIQGNV